MVFSTAVILESDRGLSTVFRRSPRIGRPDPGDREAVKDQGSADREQEPTHPIGNMKNILVGRRKSLPGRGLLFRWLLETHQRFHVATRRIGKDIGLYKPELGTQCQHKAAGHQDLVAVEHE